MCMYCGWLFVLLSFFFCVFWSSSIYVFWLPIWHLQTLLVLNSKMTSFIGHINNIMIQFTTCITLHMRIVEPIMNIIPKWLYYLYRNVFNTKLKCSFCFLTYFFLEKILKIAIYRPWLLKTIIFRWRSLRETLTMQLTLGYWFLSAFWLV